MAGKANAEKNYKQYDYISRYESIPYFYDEENNRYYYGLSYNLDTSLSYSTYKVKAGDTYSSIAANCYGNALLWWVICDFNRVPDAFERPAVGAKVKVPDIDSIKFAGD